MQRVVSVRKRMGVRERLWLLEAWLWARLGPRLRAAGLGSGFASRFVVESRLPPRPAPRLRPRFATLRPPGLVKLLAPRLRARNPGLRLGAGLALHWLGALAERFLALRPWLFDRDVRFGRLLPLPASCLALHGYGRPQHVPQSPTVEDVDLVRPVLFFKIVILICMYGRRSTNPDLYVP